MTEKRMKFLHDVPAFNGLSKSGLNNLSRICTQFEMNTEDVILKEGDEGDCVFIIEKGQVEVSMSITLSSGGLGADKSMDKILVKLGPGTMFGEMAFLFESDVRSATIVALSSGKLLKISSGDFHKFAEEDVESAYIILSNIARIIAERLRKTNKDVKKLTTALSIALRKPRKY
jgi:CRP/FNR family transcriptional regulator, cyclic AMP receptor protein